MDGLMQAILRVLLGQRDSKDHEVQTESKVFRGFRVKGGTQVFKEPKASKASKANRVFKEVMASHSQF